MTSPETVAAARRMLTDLEALADDPHRAVPFGRIVQARKVGRIAELAGEAAIVEAQLRQQFEATEGPIQNSYFCRHALGGCAVAGPPPEAPGSRTLPPLALHTVQNSVDARLITLEARCNDISEQVVLTLAGRATYGRLMRGVVFAIYSVMTRVLAAADLVEVKSEPPQVNAAVDAAAADLAAAQHRAEIVLQRLARSIYLQGVLIGAFVTLGLTVGFGLLNAHLWSGLIPTAPTVLATVFGALGAVVSVFQRMSTGKLVLDVTADQRDIRAIAVLRPAVGAVFGVVASFALSGGFLSSATDQASQTSLGLFAVAGFAAGFSERLAVDMVERAGRMLFGDPTKSQSDVPQPPAGGLAPPVVTSSAPTAPAAAPNARPPDIPTTGKAPPDGALPDGAQIPTTEPAGGG